jgi:hypothetical protein
MQQLVLFAPEIEPYLALTTKALVRLSRSRGLPGEYLSRRVRGSARAKAAFRRGRVGTFWIMDRLEESGLPVSWAWDFPVEVGGAFAEVGISFPPVPDCLFDEPPRQKR